MWAVSQRGRELNLAVSGRAVQKHSLLSQPSTHKSLSCYARPVCRPTCILDLCWCPHPPTHPHTLTLPPATSCLPRSLSQVWIVDDGKITFYNGDFEDYKAELTKEIAAELDEDEEA